jgi:hypothetical protein
MATRRGRNTTTIAAAAAPPGPPEYATCTFYATEAFSPAFDPNRVLLRRVYFIDEQRAKYVSVGFYPARDYQPFVEFGHVSRNRPTILILNAGQVKALADILPQICASMCRCEKYEFGDGDFRLNTVAGGWLVARMTLNKRYISLKLNE